MIIIIQSSYIVDEKLILLMGEYDPFGKLCSRIMAGKSAFMVDRTPLQLLDDSLIYIGFDLRGAVAGAKSVLNKKMKCPIIVNPYLGICLFPSKSPYKPDCIWFNPNHIVNTTAFGNKTKVELSNGYSITMDEKLSTFNDKIQLAQQLLRQSIERGTRPGISFYVEPKKDHQLTKEKTGKYNFDRLEKEEN